MALFKGFTEKEIVMLDNKYMIAVLSEQLALSNKAIEAQNEEIKQLRAEVKALSAQHNRKPVMPPHNEEDDILDHKGV